MQHAQGTLTPTDGSHKLNNSDNLNISPLDDHNRKLIDNVHPTDWTNPEPEPRYNLVAIGAGAAGLISTAGAAGLGGKAALIERHLLGGDCLNVGCVPSKALIRAARAFADVRDAGEYGVDVPPGTTVNFARVMERMRELRARIAPNDSAKRYTDMGVDVFLGDATFTGPDTLEVGGKTIRFSKAVITTGARAWAPDIPGLTEAGYLTNETLFNLTECPKRLAIIGAGPIGCEMAQSFARFGSEVTIFEAGDHVLSREDEDAARVVQAAMEKDGIRLCTKSMVASISHTDTEKVVTYSSPEGVRSVTVDEILVGVGRQPNVDGLGLEAAGVEYDKREGVIVNDFLQTSNSRIYAAGDICSRFKFTHTADAMARIVSVL